MNIEFVREKIEKADLIGDQKIIANVILSDFKDIGFLSGKELAERCKVSVSAITRFAQKIGYSGYPELKKDIEQFYRKNHTPYEVYEDFLNKENDGHISSDSFSQEIKNLAIMKEKTEKMKFDGVIDLMNNAPTVYLVAIATPEHLCEIAEKYFYAIGKSIEILRGIGASKKVEFTRFHPKDVVILLSFRKTFVELPDIAKTLRKKGIKTIGIVDGPASPLAAEVDHVLYAPTQELTFGLSLTAPLAMLNALINGLAIKNPKRTRKALKSVKEEWEQLGLFCD